MLIFFTKSKKNDWQKEGILQLEYILICLGIEAMALAFMHV